MQIFSDLTRGRQLGTTARCVYPLQVQDRWSDCTSLQRRRLDVAAAMVARSPVVRMQWPVCLSAVGWIRPCHDSHADRRPPHRTEDWPRRWYGEHDELCAATIEVRARGQSAVRSSMYRAVVSNSVGGVADVQRRLPAVNPPPAGWMDPACGWAGIDGSMAVLPRRAMCCVQLPWHIQVFTGRDASTAHPPHRHGHPAESDDGLFTYSTRHIPPSGGESVQPGHHEESPTCSGPLFARSIRRSGVFSPGTRRAVSRV